MIGRDAQDVQGAVRRHGESAAIVSVFTRQHGRYTGLVRGGFGRRARPIYQQGNVLQVTWRARLAEQLGKGGDEAARVVEQLEAIPNASPEVQAAIVAIRRAIAESEQAAFELTDEFKRAADAAEVNAFKLEKAAEQTKKNEEAAKELGKAWLESAAEGVGEFFDKLKEVNDAQRQFEDEARARRAQRARSPLVET